jgi:hypothetical protein
MDTTQDRGQQSIETLLGELAERSVSLIRQEIQLARAEMSDRLASAARDGALVGAAAGLGYAGLLTTLAGAVDLLHGGTPRATGRRAGLPLWLSALTVGAAATGGAAALGVRGVAGLRSRDLVPRRTLDSLRADAQLATGGRHE